MTQQLLRNERELQFRDRQCLPHSAMNDGLTCLSVNKGECTPLVIKRWSTYQCFTRVIRLDVRHTSSLFLTAFRRVRKISKSDYWFRGVCPSVRMELSSHYMDFHEILYLSIF